MKRLVCVRVIDSSPSVCVYVCVYSLQIIVASGMRLTLCVVYKLCLCVCQFGEISLSLCPCCSDTLLGPLQTKIHRQLSDLSHTRTQTYTQLT